jgi:hypothetical protein
MIGGFIDDRQYCRKNNIHRVNENNGARMTNEAAGNEKRGGVRLDCRRGGYVTPPYRLTAADRQFLLHLSARSFGKTFGNNCIGTETGRLLKNT